MGSQAGEDKEEGVPSPLALGTIFVRLQSEVAWRSGGVTLASVVGVGG